MQVSDAFMDALMGDRPLFVEWREHLAQTRCPVLLITSDPLLGGIVTPDVADEAKRIMPSLQVIRHSGAGHNIRREAFDESRSAVRGFLAAHHVAVAHA